MPVLNGRVIFTPSPREPGARWLIQREGSAVIQAFRDLLDREEGMTPSWLGSAAVPSLEERELALQSAETTLETAQAAVDATRDARDAVAVLREVLWAGGAQALRRGVTACALALGFEVDQGDEGNLVLSADEVDLHVEPGASREAVGMAPHYALRARLDAILESRAQAPRGLVVVSGHRLIDPETRKQQYSDSLRVAAESVGYALVQASDLFAGAVAALEGADAEKLATFRERLATTNGLVDVSDLLEEESDAEEEAASA
jgi:hypothetical protein